jgi:hypothetical protein
VVDGDKRVAGGKSAPPGRLAFGRFVLDRRFGRESLHRLNALEASTFRGVRLAGGDDLAVLGDEDEVELAALLVADDELAGHVRLPSVRWGAAYPCAAQVNRAGGDHGAQTERAPTPCGQSAGRAREPRGARGSV